MLISNVRSLLCFILLVQYLNGNAQDEQRFALVIGNSGYSKEVGVLPNPANDARDMAEQLAKSRFDVQLVIDASYIQIREAVRQFLHKMDSGRDDQVVGLFYYAGHGVQYQGENYLVPVDASVKYEDDIVRMCFPVQRMVLGNMERTNSRMKIVILDACRNNPFPSTSRSISAGLGELGGARGSFVAYATAPGSVASDGTGRNGLYTQELLKAMRIPGLMIEQVFKQVRRNVLHLSNEKQYTWDNSNLLGDFYFMPQSTTNQVQPAVTASLPTPNTQSVEQNPEARRVVLNRIVSEDQLAVELASLTTSAVSFKSRQSKKEMILNYFVVPYATVFIVIDNRIEERLTASTLLDRLITMPESRIKITAMENSDSGKIVELTLEID